MARKPMTVNKNKLLKYKLTIDQMYDDIILSNKFSL